MVYRWESLGWPFRQVLEETVLSGLSVFAQADGSFAIWDRAKQTPTNNMYPMGSITYPTSINLSPSDVWAGKVENTGQVLCNGLLSDWINWQYIPDNKRLFNA